MAAGSISSGEVGSQASEKGGGGPEEEKEAVGQTGRMASRKKSCARQMKSGKIRGANISATEPFWRLAAGSVKAQGRWGSQASETRRGEEGSRTNWEDG